MDNSNEHVSYIFCYHFINAHHIQIFYLNNRNRMNKTEFQAMKGSVSMRLDEKGVFKRLEDEMASMATRIPSLEKKTRLVMKS
jgi:predicted secreted acid phosphatase